ncbi:hypothetical protein Tco_1044000 [Tanacetum coccineum]|uniref:Uncharacterized protein n=1 Tax=Tanacetum coccineum TaxID=301880 RepID=A0ABQ5GPB8_9ASTR
MRRFNEIQITRAPGSDPLGHLPRRMDFLAAHVYNLAKSIPDKTIEKMNSTASTVPWINSDTLAQQLADIITATIKNNLPHMLTNSISYMVNKSSKIATMQITRNNQPLNYKIFDDFKLKMMGFTKWLEFHGVASKRQNATNDQLLKNLKAKFKWVATTADKLGIPPPLQLTNTELPPTKRKKSRIVEMIKEVFVSEDIVVDGMHMNLTVPQRANTKDALKQSLPFMKEGGSAPSLSSLQHFRMAGEGPMTFEEAQLQLQETKRLAELKDAKEKSEEKLRRLTLEQLKA